MDNYTYMYEPQGRMPSSKSGAATVATEFRNFLQSWGQAMCEGGDQSRAGHRPVHKITGFCAAA